jgi:apolipoprotein N-acyltransferase
MKTIFIRLLAATATALLLHFSWPTQGFIFFIFIAFLPLLWVEYQIAEAGGKRLALNFFGYSYFAFALFNLIATMWVKNAHVSGPIATTFINGALMATVFFVYHLLKKHLGFKRAIFTFPFGVCHVFH